MTDINKIRSDIDRVDSQLIELFVERMRLCDKIVAAKRATGAGVRDIAREERVVENASARAGEYAHYGRCLCDALMSLSRRRQRGLNGVCGLIGESLKHSDSRDVHARFGLDGYGIFELERSEIADFLNVPENNMINVTIPYKREVVSYMDELTDDAIAAGCVNSIKFSNGKKIGGNTDVYGIMYAVSRRKIDISGRTALVFGNGGGARATKIALERLGALSIRLLSHAEIDAREFEREYDKYDIIVNATPVGMFPRFDETPCDPARFTRAFLAIDLIYNPWRTRFLQRAGSANMITINGLSLLVAQAGKCEEWCLEEAISEMEVERAIRALALQNTSIALVGMPGAGKSAIGARLASVMGRKFIETDALIASDAGMSAADIIDAYCEADFRRRESIAVQIACRERGSVIATGGGCALSEENRRALSAHCCVYHILRDIEDLATDGRPLSRNVDLRSMENARMSGYIAARDRTVQNATTIEAAADVILSDFYEWSREGFGVI